MRQIFFSFLLLLSGIVTLGQSHNAVRVKAGENLAQAFSANGFYRLPQFTKAKLAYTNGQGDSRFLFNYNICSGNLEFISPLGDTLDMTNASSIDSIQLGEVVYFYRKGFMELMGRIDEIRLLKKVVVSIQTEKIGGYGQPNPTSSIDNLRTFTMGNNFYSLTVNQDVVMNKNTTWFLMGADNNLVRANKTSLLKMLSGPKQVFVENYLKQNKVNFERENDLMRLVNALAGT